MIDLDAARRFIHSHARLLERRRFQYAFDGAPPGIVLAALNPYRNGDGGVGALEPDLRTPASQPVATRYAFDVLSELPPSAEGDGFARRAFDWLVTITNADGGVPFVLPSALDQPAAPWLRPAPESALLMTVQLAAAGRRLQLDHPWLSSATDYCWREIEHSGDHSDDRPGGMDAYTLRYVADFLDTVPGDDRTAGRLANLRSQVPADGILGVEGGAAGEHLDPLEVAPRPDHAGAGLFGDGVLDRALDDLEAAQLDDGGFDFSWAKWNPAAAWEWRGVVTVAGLRTLRAHKRL